ncbi:hypothetical protein [Albibacillus kandeliae]|uniref:hypothetical protein n=1 Tax=Albibacillus kandeliae TaxID=2174228 RepID=UPI001E2C1EC7|nr:hypothetical protein [Albibacillus kandeliae]
MTSLSPILKPVDADELELYPISVKDRLDSHYFMQWNLKRWRASEFRRKADPEVGWYGFNLFCIAQDETPVGTLPCDEEQLAYELRVPLEKWRAMMERKITPLHNWHRVRCDNGEVRFAHPIVTLVAEDALKSKRLNAAANANERHRKRVISIRKSLSGIPGASRFAEGDAWVEQISDWIEAQYPGRSCTISRVKEALNALSSRV